MRQPLIGTLLMLTAGLIGDPASAAAPAASAAVAASAPATHAMTGHPDMTAAQRNRPKVVSHYVDINSASRKELMTLPGVGPAEADKIVANRPYLTKTELVTKGVLPTGPFLSLKNQVVAMQKLPRSNTKGKS
jgi:competence protein ComEA